MYMDPMTKTNTAAPGLSSNHVSLTSLWQPKRMVVSAWLEHAPFSFWLMERIKPRLLVELGTHYGFSYGVFCQAVDQLQLETKCFAVDTWLGDEHAGFYDDTIFKDLSAYNAQHYSDFSELLRMTFEEALPLIDDRSVDLLHIDGRHFYDDAKRDFQSWLPKLSDRGVVLIHDTNVYERGFGVHQLWKEISATYPTFEFLHGHGLGIVGVGKDLSVGITDLFSASASTRDAIRSVYETLGRGISSPSQIAALEAELGVQRLSLARAVETIKRLEATREGLEASQSDLREAYATLEEAYANLAASNTILQESDKQLKSIEGSISWRMTAPFRSRAFQHLRNILQKLGPRS
jgi:hypothetical protein